MYYLIYKITNLINGKYYIGAHKTKNINDNYLGSGVALNRAVKKYGREHFKKEILHRCIDEKEMFLLEEKLVDHNDPLSYNLRCGGKGGFDHIDNCGEKNSMKNPETVKKVIETSRQRGSYHTEKRKELQKFITEKAKEKNTGRKRINHSHFMKSWNVQYWKENREKQRDALSSTFVVTDPEGNNYTTNRLQDFCKEYNLTYTAIWKTTRSNTSIKKGKSKGWICKKI